MGERLMMRFALGFATGLATAWAALAIWQRVPELGPIDDGDADTSEARRDHYNITEGNVL